MGTTRRRCEQLCKGFRKSSTPASGFQELSKRGNMYLLKIRFVESSNGVRVFVKNDDDGCWSAVGHQGRLQELNLAGKSRSGKGAKVTLDIDPPFLLSDHRLLQFESTPTSLIPAYDSFLLDVKFWHIFKPSRLLFTAKFSNLNFEMRFQTPCYP